MIVLVLVVNLIPNCFALYLNGPKFSDRQAFANSVDPDQTAPRGAPRGAVRSGSTLFVILTPPFGQISLWKDHFV